MNISEKRKVLIDLSEKARLLREQRGEDCTINSILVNDFYKDDNNEEFKTFWEWKKDGFNIIKGSKAFLVWGSKRKAEKQTENNEEPEQYKFFPICFLFSNSQVEKNKKNENKDLHTA